MQQDRQKLKERAWAAIEELRPELEAVALRILEHPELGYSEVQASGWLGGLLEAHGFEVERPFGGLETAFRATSGPEKRPNVAFLAEYDALPEVGHGCGHNLIGPAAVGAALGVASVAGSLDGSVSVIGTPAEEYLGQVEGKLKLLEAGAFRDVDVALMVHPQYANRILGGDLGFVACEISFAGRPAHAAADPWNGANALDGLLLTFNNINALRQQLHPEIRVHGIVTDGGQAPNIIPERAAAQLMVRADTPEKLEAAYARVEDCARAGALASGTEVTISRTTTVYNSRVNSTLNRLILENFDLLGVGMDHTPCDLGGSTDFGNVSQELPAAMFLVETHPSGIPWHSAEVAALAGDALALRGMLTGAKVLAGVALDLLGDAALLAQVQEDFARG
ncbi:MAG: amidohydrolase [Anaerolineae bacterium]|nr:amidohydrolase [Anaerolineae bacterium]